MIYNTEHLPPENEVLKTDLQWITFYNYYSQVTEEGVSENWTQAVTRAVENLRQLSSNMLDEVTYQAIFDAIYLQDVLPSMRLFSMPKAAIERCNTVLYNCAFLPIDTFTAISELMYLTMSGVGCGYTVENAVLCKLPTIPTFSSMFSTDVSTHTVTDSQIGWADSVKFLFDTVLSGRMPVFDYSQVRPAGERLKTKGGFASGPAPLKLYHTHVLDVLSNAEGRALTSLEVHDIVNMISECAVSNGSRSGALICLFDDNDTDMLNAKSDPEWYPKTPWRSYSNNSVVVNGTTHEFIDDVVNTLIYDETGEPGLFSRDTFKRSGRLAKDCTGVNPCGEIMLNSTFGEDGGGQFCNLSTVVLHPHSFDGDNLYKQLDLATLIGTIQSTATKFRYLRPGWKQNCDEEMLLGVCVTGSYDYKEQFNPGFLDSMKEYVIEANKRYAKQLGVSPSTSTTSSKPSGNTSVLTNTSPGTNPDFGTFQIRNIRVGKHSKMAKFLLANNVPLINDPAESISAKYIAAFPRHCTAPKTLENSTAKEQIENYLMWEEYYVTHSVSITITYDESEKDWVANWIKENYRTASGMTFFPKDISKYPYKPIEVVSEVEFDRYVKYDLDWTEFASFTEGDATLLKVAECSGERCDIQYT